ncbi:MAG: flagellar biosynthesis anti-sigma factor FlgM [Lachnospiraceae bacterium]
MKISLNNINHYQKNQINPRRHSLESSIVPKDSKNFDAIIIQSDSRKIEERKFTESLTRQVSAEVHNASASADRIDQLKAQVADGSYPMDADLIASKMLLLKGDYVHA